MGIPKTIKIETKSFFFLMNPYLQNIVAHISGMRAEIEKVAVA